ncbi:phosphatidate cytidylyltransferase [Bdellovibrio bacteriovorus]|uniref:Putative phosphatidate cytidiltransferase n=1 Tax=Bdellovibrio bacteriovorus str. Tiberius TaxID=1069642 RepID=K7YRM1_BDEBC|nr:phosphatidate cytidylyltransferase [Bdellovibrio bacteriovorus]AFY02511.1 putative phosphatidate cytidiltransferase [Bdellovibrio bacteriovorus str. Tiberius]
MDFFDLDLPIRMAMPTAWENHIYRQTVLIVLSIIFASGLIVFFFRQKNYYFVQSWASIKSWLIAAPLMFLAMGMPEPWPLVALTALAILGAKIFFQIMGMFHRSYFVMICYAGIIGLGVCAWYDRLDVYNAMPMVVLGLSCLVPLVKNSYKRMIQYISLTLLAFIFLGWSFMHLGLIMKMPNGVFQVMYLVILTEFCDNTNLAVSRYIGGWKMFPGINPRRTVGSTIVSALLTLFLAGCMRFLLPDGSEKYWLASGLVASMGGFVGDYLMTVVRRDAGMKTVGPFIIGRGDFLHRMDRLIFVAPIYYYVMTVIL